MTVGERDGKECVGLLFSSLLGKHPEKRQLGRPQRECEDVSLDLREVSCLVMVQDHVQWRGFGISDGARLDLTS